jgi:hypothetical protein
LKANLETTEAVCEIHHAVIPAEAGIQFLNSLRIADKAAFKVLSYSVRIIYLPGFPPSRE